MFNEKIDKKFTAHAIALRLNRERSTIIKWEISGKIPPANRNNKGSRIYSLEDFENIKQIISNDDFYQRKPKR